MCTHIFLYEMWWRWYFEMVKFQLFNEHIKQNLLKEDKKKLVKMVIF